VQFISVNHCTVILVPTHGEVLVLMN